jgi:hypothetical protein
MQSDDTVNKPWFNSRVSGSVIFHIMDLKMLVIHIFALVWECIPPDLVFSDRASEYRLISFTNIFAHVWECIPPDLMFSDHAS